jgi:hypothetical protein
MDRDWTLRDHRKQWDSLSGLKHAKFTHSGTLCPQIKETLKAEQKPATMGDYTVHMTPSHKRIPLYIGTGKQPQA